MGEVSANGTTDVRYANNRLAPIAGSLFRGRAVNRVRISIDPSDLVLEIISIVVAILLALAVNLLAGQVKTHNDVLRTLAAISSEMSSNETAIGRIHARHLSKCGMLQNLARRGRGHKLSYTAYQNASMWSCRSRRRLSRRRRGISPKRAAACRGDGVESRRHERRIGELRLRDARRHRPRLRSNKKPSVGSRTSLRSTSGPSSLRATRTSSWWLATPHSTAHTSRPAKIVWAPLIVTRSRSRADVASATQPLSGPQSRNCEINRGRQVQPRDRCVRRLD